MLDELELDADDGDDDSWFSWGGGSGRTLSSGAIFLLSLVLLFWNETSSKAIADARAGAMATAGHIFHLSDNNVWLTAAVPLAFLDFPD